MAHGINLAQIQGICVEAVLRLLTPENRTLFVP